MTEVELAKLRAEFNIVMEAVRTMGERQNTLMKTVEHHAARVEHVEAIHQDLVEMNHSIQNAARAIEQLARGAASQMENNSNKTAISIGNHDPRWIAGIVVTILGVIGYLIYIGGWRHHGGDAAPPPAVEETSESNED